jgi:S-methylmethionine-dependent homocysteine/selenocysteine methylase
MTEKKEKVSNELSLQGSWYPLRSRRQVLERKDVNLRQALQGYDLVLMEAAVSEIMGQRADVRVDPQLGAAPCIFDPLGQEVLKELYLGFINAARQGGVPLLVTAPTWRTNRERIVQTGVDPDINRQGVDFMKSIRDQAGDFAPMIVVGGLLGCKNDAYKPEQGVSPDQAAEFHAWQAERLAEAGAEFLMAATLPAVPEALGMARAMASTGVDFIVSFVINRQGLILDGHTLEEAFTVIDENCSPPPLGYMINCAYPSFIQADAEPQKVLSRLIGYQANGSSLDHAELDGAEGMLADDITDWAGRMIELKRRFGIKILGGCCGTTSQHLEALVSLAAGQADKGLA